MPNHEALFSLANAAAVVGWLLLIVAPRWRWTDKLVLSGAWSLVLSVVYPITLAAGMASGAEGGFGSLREVRALFSNDLALLAGWVHYLAFDLYVGAVVSRIARREGVPHPFMIPVLFLTFMFGPVGLLAFWIVRSMRAKTLAAATP